jgi:DnaJ domain
MMQSFRHGYYRDLGLEGLESSASQEDIKRAYRALAFVWHPDRHPNAREAAETRMKDLNTAFEVLGDPEKRTACDDWLRQEAEAPTPEPQDPEPVVRPHDIEDPPPVPTPADSRTMLDWPTFVRTAALVLIALVLVKVFYLGRPRPALMPGDNGAPSPADDYQTLRIKAYSSRNVALLDFLQSLEPGGDNGPLVVTRWPLLLDGRLSNHPSPWRIYVPGDVKLDALDWQSTIIQRVPLAGVHGIAEITPQVLSALAQRRQKISDIIQHPGGPVRPFRPARSGAPSTAAWNFSLDAPLARFPWWPVGRSTPCSANAKDSGFQGCAAPFRPWRRLRSRSTAAAALRAVRSVYPASAFT